MAMETPKSTSHVSMILDSIGVDPEVKQMVESFALAEFRRGYLLGQREMKQRVEDSLASMWVDPA